MTHCPHPRVLKEDQDLLILRDGDSDPSAERVTALLSSGVFLVIFLLKEFTAGTQAWFAHFSPLTQRVGSQVSALWT